MTTIEVGTRVRYIGPSPECDDPGRHGPRIGILGIVTAIEPNEHIAEHDVGLSQMDGKLTWARIDEIEPLDEWGESTRIEARTWVPA